MNGHSIQIKDTDVKVLGRAVSITTDKTLVAAEQTVDETFDPNKTYPGTFEDHSQWTINRLLKSKIDMLSQGIPSDIDTATTDKYGIVRLASSPTDSDPWDVVPMNVFGPLYNDFYDDSLDSSGFWFKGVKPTVDLLKQCCSEVKERIETLEKKNSDVINRIPNTTLQNVVWSEDGSTVTFDIVADTGFYISSIEADSYNASFTYNDYDKQYPIKYTVTGSVDDIFEYDIYVDGNTSQIVSQDFVFSVTGTGVKDYSFIIPGEDASEAADMVLSIIRPMRGFQIKPIIDNMQLVPNIETISVEGNNHINLLPDDTPGNLNNVIVFSTDIVEDNISINTNDYYTTINVPIKVVTQNCSVTLSDTETTPFNLPGGSISTDATAFTRMGGNIKGSITLNDNCVLRSVRAYVDYDDVQKEYEVTNKNSNFSVFGIGYESDDFIDVLHYLNIRTSVPGVDVDTMLEQMIMEGMVLGLPITVEVIAEETISYPVTWTGEHFTATPRQTSVEAGGTFSTTITPDSGYKLNGVVVTHNGRNVEVTQTEDSAFVQFTNVSGPITVSVSVKTPPPPAATEYTVTYTGTSNVKDPNKLPQVVAEGSLYQAFITAANGYSITSAVIKSAANPSTIIPSTWDGTRLESANNITENIIVAITTVQNTLNAIFSDDQSNCDIVGITRDKKTGTMPATGGQARIAITASGASWNITSTAHSYTLDHNTLADDTIPPLSVTTISPTSGSGNHASVIVTIPRNTTYGQQKYTITVSNGSTSINLTITQWPIAEYAVRVSDGYIASPYSNGATVIHKFFGNWRRMQGETGSAFDPSTDINFDGLDVTLGELSASSGTADDLLVITSLTNVDPSWEGTSDDSEIFFEVQGEDRRHKLHLWHASDNAATGGTASGGFGSTLITLEDNVRTANRITNVELDGQPVAINQSGAYAGSANITGNADGQVSVTLENVSNLSSEDIKIYYTRLPYDNSGVIGDTKYEMVENVLLKEIDFTYDSATGTITFDADGSIIIPANGFDSPHVWFYRLVLS